MSRIFRDSSVLNQFGSPSINSNTFANRPAFGQPGRLFVSTDTLAIFRDTGTAWDNLTDNPGNIGTLQEVTTNGNQTTVNIQILARESLFSKTFDTSDIGGDATNMINIGSNVNLSSNVLGINNIYSESFKTITSNITLEDDSFHDNTFLYSAINNNSLSPKTITVTQGTFINALSSLRIQSIFSGTNSLNISHYASIIVNPLTITNTTITNYYGLLINNSTGSTITNRYGIYQDGINDNNYFAAKINIGNSNTTFNSSQLNVLGTSQLLSTSTSGTSVIFGNTSFQWNFNTSIAPQILSLGHSANNVLNIGFDAPNNLINIFNAGNIDIQSNFFTIGGNSNSPISSARFVIESTTKGAIIPRMTTAQINAIASPVNGLLAYSTDGFVLCFYDSSVGLWKKVTNTNL